MQLPPAVSPHPLRALGVVVVLAAVGTALPLLVAAHYGARGIPRGDDWSYLLVQFRFVDGGGLHLNNWVSMTLVGQILLAAPVAWITGHSVAAMQVFTAVVGLVGLVAVVRLGRHLGQPLWSGALVAAMIALGPLWGPLAASFMTDVPAFGLGVVCLAIGGEALRRRPWSPALFAASLAVGFLGFAIRQYAIVAPLAVATTGCWVLAAAGDRGRLRRALALSGVLVVLAAVLLAWWRSLPGAFSLTPAVPTFHSVRTSVIKLTNMLRLVGLLVSPAVILAGPVRIVRGAWHRAPRTALALGVAASALLALIYLRVPQRPFVNNYVAREGALATDVLSGRRPDVIPRGAFELLVVVGSIAGVLLVLAAVPLLVDLARRVRERELGAGDPVVTIVGLSIGGYSLLFLAAQLAGLPLYDRYVLPIVPLAALAVLRATGTAGAHDDDGPAPDRRPFSVAATASAGVALAGMAVVGLAFSSDSASFDASRWRAATLATRQGFAPLQIDGGFEWNDYHLGHATQLPPQYGGPKRLPKSQQPPVPQCVRVVVNPSHVDGRVVASVESTAVGRSPTRIVAVWRRRCVPYRGRGRSGAP